MTLCAHADENGGKDAADNKICGYLVVCAQHKHLLIDSNSASISSNLLWFPHKPIM